MSLQSNTWIGHLQGLQQAIKGWMISSGTSTLWAHVMPATWWALPFRMSTFLVDKESDEYKIQAEVVAEHLKTENSFAFIDFLTYPTELKFCIHRLWKEWKEFMRGEFLVTLPRIGAYAFNFSADHVVAPSYINEKIPMLGRIMWEEGLASFCETLQFIARKIYGA